MAAATEEFPCASTARSCPACTSLNSIQATVIQRSGTTTEVGCRLGDGWAGSWYSVYRSLDAAVAGAVALDIPAGMAVSPVRDCTAWPTRSTLPSVCANVTQSLREKRRWLPGVCHARRWPWATARRRVERDTPQTSAASPVVRNSSCSMRTPSSLFCRDIALHTAVQLVTNINTISISKRVCGTGGHSRQEAGL